MQDSKLLKNAEGQSRTLYSLRHIYATLELLEHNTDIHTLAKQMGNLAAMIERYSKLTPTMAADRLAWIRGRSEKLSISLCDGCIGRLC